jgi:hypothetical protein
MLALRLVRLIEPHCDKLAQGLTEKLLHSERTQDFRKIPRDELEARTREVYRNLSEWLLNKTESDIEVLYTELGERRAAQGVEFCQFVWAIIIIKEHIWSFLQSEALEEQAVDLFGEFELFQLLEQFFDRALYYAAVGYGRVQGAKIGHAARAMATEASAASVARLVP